MNPHIKSHYCWTAPRQRVHRVGHAMKCVRCRRFTKKHKCGAVKESADAWKEWPVEECAACNPVHKPGVFPAGPTEREPAWAPPRPPKPSQAELLERHHKFGEKRARLAKSRKRSQNLRLLVLAAISEGHDTTRGIRDSLTLFGADHKATRGIVRDMVKENIITASRVPFDGPKFMSSYQMRYSVNPAIVAKMGDDQ